MRWLNNLIFLYPLPPLSLLFQLLNIEVSRKLFEYPTTILIFVIAILVSILVHGFSNKKLACFTFLALAILLLLIVESFHVMNGGNSIDNLFDIRFFLYSPLYGEILIFALYGAYISLLEERDRWLKFRFCIRASGILVLTFLVLVELAKFDFIQIPFKNELYKSNLMANFCLVLISIITLFRGRLELKQSEQLIWCSLFLIEILVTSSKGAIVGCLFLFSWILYNKFSHQLSRLLFISIIFIIFWFTYYHFQPDIFRIYEINKGLLELVIFSNSSGWTSLQTGWNSINFGDYLSENGIYAEEKLGIYQLLGHLKENGIYSEEVLSSLSRIGSIFYATILFVENPVLGIGQALAYEVKVFSSGIHSFFFLLCLASGLVGLLAFVLLIISLVYAQPHFEWSANASVLFLISFGIVLLFLNSIPAYLALIFGVIGLRNHEKKAIV